MPAFWPQGTVGDQFRIPSMRCWAMKRRRKNRRLIAVHPSTTRKGVGNCSGRDKGEGKYPLQSSGEKGTLSEEKKNNPGLRSKHDMCAQHWRVKGKGERGTLERKATVSFDPVAGNEKLEGREERTENNGHSSTQVNC